MTGWMLRIVGAIVLTAVAGLSTSRVICWVPCVLEDQAHHGQAAGGASHCAPDTVGAGARLTGFGGACDACDQLRLIDADRLASRNSVLIGMGVSAVAGITVSHPSATSSAHSRWRADTPPNRRSSVPVLLPLRI